MARRIAIVGAGPAGAGAAYRLGDVDAEVTVFERRDGPGGRAATRRRDGHVYDVGANYLKADDDRVVDLVTDELSAGLVEVDGPVWTVDADGTVEPGDRHEEHKWTYRDGLATLGDRLLDRADATLAFGTEVVGLDRTDGRWTVETAEGGAERDRRDAGGPAARSTDPFDAVVLTPPAPVAAALLEDVGADPDRPAVADLRDAAREVPYRRITTVACAYDRRLEWPCYALVDVSKTRDLGWVAREECKPGHVPDGRSLVIAQSGPDWSRRHAGDPDDAVAAAAADLVAALVRNRRLATPAWTDVVHWPHALADDRVPESVVEAAAERGLVAAGDWVAGEARVHAALRSGLEAADRLRQA